MTDSRLRGEWLGQMRFDDLSDVAWRVFTCALMWSNENGTDGRIPDRYLKQLHPDGIQTEAHTELVKAELWTKVPTGYMFLDWDGALGQMTAAYVTERRRAAAERSRKKREREKKAMADKNATAESQRLEPEPVTRDVPANVHAHVGIGRGRGPGLGRGELPQSEDDAKVHDWPVVQIGGQAS